MQSKLKALHGRLAELAAELEAARKNAVQYGESRGANQQLVYAATLGALEGYVTSAAISAQVSAEFLRGILAENDAFPCGRL